MSGLIYHVDKRRILPLIQRVHSYHDTKVADTSLSYNHPKIEFKDDDLKIKMEEWNVSHNVALAGEILSHAIITNRIGDVGDVLTFLLKKFPNDLFLEKIFSQVSHKIDVNYKISLNREKLNREPKDAITWTDQAINYIVKGHREKAMQCITNALSINHDSAFIVRNASRIFNILGDNGRAIQTLKKSHFYQHDPQILSAEIAFSELEHRRTKGVDFGRKILLENKFTAWQISELASAIGTIEFFKGDFKKSESYFDQSLIDPNSNSLSQSLWYKKGSIADIHFSKSSVSNEIQTHRHTKNNDFVKSFNYAKKWIEDERYSSRPYNTAAYLCGVLNEDFDAAYSILLDGLNHQKLIKGNEFWKNDDFAYRNDLSYYLLKAGRIEEVENLFLPIANFLKSKLSPTTDSEYVYLATSGLLLYKSGNPVQAKKLYKRTINHFLNTNKLYKARVAFINFFMEEIKFEAQVDELIKLKKELIKIIPDTAENDVVYLRDKWLSVLETQLKEVSSL